MLASFLSGEFLLHIPCWLLYYVPSFSYTSRGDFFFICGVSLTHPVLASFLGREFLLHSQCWLLCVGSFSYTSSTGFFMWGVSLTHSVLASFVGSFTHSVLASVCGEFFLHILCWFLYMGSFSYKSCAGFFMWGVSLTCPMLAI